VWLFDLKTRKGKKLALPDIQFANFVLQGNALYVSDNRADRLYRIEPADFLNSKAEPKISVVFSGKGVNPNGRCSVPSGMRGQLTFGFRPETGPTIRTLALCRLSQIAPYEAEQIHGAVRFGHIVVATGGTRLLFVPLHGEGTHGNDWDRCKTG
jgi:hypothetical protein